MPNGITISAEHLTMVADLMESLRANMKPIVSAGGFGTDTAVNGVIFVYGKDGNPVIALTAVDDEARIEAGQTGGRPGRLSLFDGNLAHTIMLTAKDARVEAGGGGIPGRIHLLDKNDRLTVYISGDEALIAAGPGAPGGTPGRVRLYDGENRQTLLLDAQNALIAAGPGAESGTAGRIQLHDGNNKLSVVLDGAAGDVVLVNADCAEDFDVEGDPGPGTVVVLTDDGVARPCDRPYDSRGRGRRRRCGGLSARNRARSSSGRPSATADLADGESFLSRRRIRHSGDAGRPPHDGRNPRARDAGHRSGKGLRGRLGQGTDRTSGRDRAHSHPRDSSVIGSRTPFSAEILGGHHGAVTS